jgi:iron complex transport system substrate-binding protein
MCLATTAACGSDDDSGRPTTSVSSTTPADTTEDVPTGPTGTLVHDTPLSSAATSAVQAFPRTVVGAAGDVEIPQRPERIIATGAQVDLDSLVVLGIDPVAAGTFFGDTPEWLADALADAVLFDVNDTNLEQVAGLTPDLIIGPADVLDPLAEQLGQIAPTLLIDTSQSWRSNLELIAEATGRENEAETFLTDFDALVADTQALTEPYRNVEVSALTVGPDGTALILAARSSIGEALTLAGIARVDGQDADTEFIPISEELIGDLDGDVIVVYHSQFLAPQWEEFASSPLWQAIPAVADGRVVVTTDDRWFFATPLSVEFGVGALVPDILVPGFDDAG